MDIKYIWTVDLDSPHVGRVSIPVATDDRSFASAERAVMECGTYGGDSLVIEQITFRGTIGDDLGPGCWVRVPRQHQKWVHPPIPKEESDEDPL